MPLDQFMLQMEGTQHAVIIMARRQCVFLPWIGGKLSEVPLLAWTGLACEDDKLEQMRWLPGRAAFSRWRQRGPSAPLPACARRMEFPERLAQGTISLGVVEPLWFSLLSPFMGIPLVAGHTRPAAFFSTITFVSACFQMPFSCSLFRFSLRVAAVWWDLP